MILLTGFGAFGSVSDNPSGRLVRAMHGRRVAGHTLVGTVLPVTYGPGLDLAVRWAENVAPALILGFGVATTRDRVDVESLAFNQTHLDRPDMAGQAPGVLDPDGPAEVAATVDVAALAEALDARVSEDAGRYVCNAWLYRMVRAFPEVPVTFVHVPPQGMATERLEAGLAAYLSRDTLV